MTKVQRKLYLEPEMAEQIDSAVAQFKAAGRKVSRNEVLEQLIEDGFKSWKKEAQIVNRVEASIGKLLDQAVRQDRLIRSVLLTLAEGDQAAVDEAIAAIERKDKANARTDR